MGTLNNVAFPTLSDIGYREQLTVLQQQLTRLQVALFLQKKRALIVLEGTDAPLAIMVISDRISAFDCIWHGEGGMNGVPGKGAALKDRQPQILWGKTSLLFPLSCL